MYKKLKNPLKKNSYQNIKAKKQITITHTHLHLPKPHTKQREHWVM